MWIAKYEEKLAALIKIFPPFIKDDFQEWIRLCRMFFDNYEIKKTHLGTYRNVNKMKTLLLYSAIMAAMPDIDNKVEIALLETHKYSFTDAEEFLCAFFKTQ
jgi:hypothetical protein